MASREPRFERAGRPTLRLLGTAAALALMCAARPAAFGDPGHRIVGHVAEAHLAGTRALQEVRRILPPKETLAEAGLWADRVRTGTVDDPEAATFRLAHPAHESYHYTNVPFQATRYEPGARGAHFTDIVRMTRECILVLRGRSDAFTRREALRLLAHYTGDIHQPLHVGNGFVAADGPLRFVVPDGPAGWRQTLGGNALRYGPNDNFSLHGYWDAHVVNLLLRKGDPASFAQRIVRELAPDAAWRTAGDVDGWPAHWATEVLPIAREAYEGITLTEYLGHDERRGVAQRWRITQRPGYDAMATARVRVQLARAGYRLAAVLRAIWP